MKSVVCAIAKNERRYIREWVEYNLSIGFDAVHVFEDYTSESHADLLSDLMDDGRVVLTPMSETPLEKHKFGTWNQTNLYKWFLEKCREERIADWAAFIDVDEFIAFEEGWDLSRLEDEFSDTGGVLLWWKLYGADGHVERPEGKVVDNYKSHLPIGTPLDDTDFQWNFKSLVHVPLCTGMKTIHWFEDCVFTDRKDDYAMRKMSFSKAWVNHYYTKSWEDYLDRIFKRGNMMNNYRSLDQFFHVSPEFMPMRKEMIEAQRYRHTVGTMWVSRQEHIISGGNRRRLLELTEKYMDLNYI